MTNEGVYIGKINYHMGLPGGDDDRRTNSALVDNIGIE